MNDPMSENLSTITFFDKFNSAVLGLVTSEMPELNRIRKKNSYDNSKPTFEKPYNMPFKEAIIDDVRIRYASTSQDKEKPTIVMLSPFPHSIMAYAPIWKILEPKYNLWAYDMPGFGRSDSAYHFMSFKYQGEFLKKFLEHFNLESAHLLGPDVGMPAILYYVGSFDNKISSIIVGDGPAISPSANASVIRKMVY